MMPDKSFRIQSIDVVRGAVMVLMAIDHVRVYSGLPAGGPTAGIFFTRWVTHFCAPAFAFLAGTSAFLYGKRLGDQSALARYLVRRGILLVVVELTVIRLTWTFNLDYAHFVLAGVIWMLGWCMILLSALLWLPTQAIGIIGLGFIFFQQVLRALPRALPQQVKGSVGWIWEFIYPTGLKHWDGLIILYVLVPWVGVMAAGYAFGAVMIRQPRERRQICLRIGGLATLCFVLGGCVAILLHPGQKQPLLFQLLDQQKYPASQLFLLMTLGPAIALLPLAERRGWFSEILATFGRVPMFYYLLHIPAIHLAALVVTVVREGNVYPQWYTYAPFTQVPPAHRWGLPLLYLVFICLVAGLYGACRWFAGVKARHPHGWLRYL
jgi:uncharacterized membrane protein